MRARVAGSTEEGKVANLEAVPDEVDGARDVQIVWWKMKGDRDGTERG